VFAAAAAAGGSGNGGAGSGGGHVEMRALAISAEAEAAAEPVAAPATDVSPAVQLDDVLRTIKLLERREADLRDETKDLIGLMKSAAQALMASATAAPSVLPLHLQRLERCVLPACAPARAGPARSWRPGCGRAARGGPGGGAARERAGGLYADAQLFAHCAFFHPPPQRVHGQGAQGRRRGRGRGRAGGGHDDG
jgi:hypothetical protein